MVEKHTTKSFYCTMCRKFYPIEQIEEHNQMHENEERVEELFQMLKKENSWLKQKIEEERTKAIENYKKARDYKKKWKIQNKK